MIWVSWSPSRTWAWLTLERSSPFSVMRIAVASDVVPPLKFLAPEQEWHTFGLGQWPCMVCPFDVAPAQAWRILVVGKTQISRPGISWLYFSNQATKKYSRAMYYNLDNAMFNFCSGVNCTLLWIKTLFSSLNLRSFDAFCKIASQPTNSSGLTWIYGKEIFSLWLAKTQTSIFWEGLVIASCIDKMGPWPRDFVCQKLCCWFSRSLFNPSQSVYYFKNAFG